MKAKKIILMDMTNEVTTNGVSRCIQSIAEGFQQEKGYEVIWIRFTFGTIRDIQQRLFNGYTIIQIPLPNDMLTFLQHQKVRQSYWENTYKTINPYLSSSFILHIHTLNLIELALLIKGKTDCKIVTHLHCIPWKGLYNTNIKLFNQLYQQYYLQKDYSHPSRFIRQRHELLAYTKSDCLICVTECARKFVESVCSNHTKIKVIANGLKDTSCIKDPRENSSPIKCLFVGNSHTSKGLGFVLAAMQAILIQHPASLTVVGSIPNEIRNRIMNQFPFLDIQFTGQVTFGQLQQVYAESDIGIIGSIQEQCSYVAIEMMMMGLPVITTNVDGLDELFTDKYNGLKVPVIFTAKDGLRVDILRMSEAIIQLCNDVKLRKQISTTARKQFLKRHSIKQMIKEIKEVYSSLAS